MSITVTRQLEIRVTDSNGGTACVVYLDATGPRSFSGRLLAEQGDGRRVDVDALGLLCAVYAAGQKSIAEGEEGDAHGQT